MANEQWMMEWVDTSHIRTFQRKHSGDYEMLRPLGNDVFGIQAAQKEDYVRYWNAWIGYSGYTDIEADVCIVCPNNVAITEFLSAAREAGIRIASPTEWSIQAVLECFKQTGRYAKAEASETSPVKITFEDGLILYANSGDGGDFRSSEIREISEPIMKGQEASGMEGKEEGVSFTTDKVTMNASGGSAQATKEEVREAIRRISHAQCRTIDNKR